MRQRLTDEERAAIGQAELRRRRPLPDGRGREPASNSGRDMIARLRARARAARPELDAWEQERRDWIRQEPARRPATNPGRAR
jgi:hypothetical protein